MTSKPMEIERKFLVKDNSWKGLAEDAVMIEQYYFIDDNGVDCRVRSVDHTYFQMTMKIRVNDLSSEEYEFDIPEEVFNEFKKRSLGGIKKVRYIIFDNDKTWEVDVFADNNEGLVLAEVELDSTVERVSLPSFIGEEVTSKMEYKNVNLSKN